MQKAETDFAHDCKWLSSGVRWVLDGMLGFQTGFSSPGWELVWAPAWNLNFIDDA
jgi:hypothetical protein